MGCQVAKLIFARAPGWITAATEPNGQPVPVWVAQGPLDLEMEGETVGEMLAKGGIRCAVLCD